ncbi:transketolase [Paracoccus sp. KCTC 42845]|uniref:Transketolase n=2 Tax=Paracoccus aerius TaxID=1915382 RepID=A0ABS1SAQ0_9RHOB|nr:transketolase [Paracoccus aerius]
MIAPRGQGYVAQGLGAADIFATLYFDELRLDPSRPDWEERDRCILSTAHNSAVFLATLAERGFFPTSRLAEYTTDGSALEINVSERMGPVVEATCGSLGQGLSVAVGMALSARRKDQDHRIYVILGDGELQEGQVWEAAMAAGSYGLSNICLIIDLNWMQVEGDTDLILKMRPIAEKWDAFGWNVEFADGNDIDQLRAALDRSRSVTNKPSVIIAETLVGKGIEFLEGKKSHNMKLPPELAARALEALEISR